MAEHLNAGSDNSITETNCCILVLSGIPAAGKSFIGRQSSTWLLESNHYIPILIEYDQLMSADHEKTLITQNVENKSGWKKYRENIVKCVEYLIQNVTKMKNMKSDLSDLDKSLVAKFIELLKHQNNKCEITEQLNIGNTSILSKSHSEKTSTCEPNKEYSILKDSDSSLSTNSSVKCKDKCDSSSSKNNTTLEDSISTLENLFTYEKPLIIIIDDNMYYRSMRYDYYQLARTYSLGFCQIHIECPLDTAINRNAERISGKVDPMVIKEMAEKMQIPDASANTWEKYSVITSSSVNMISRTSFMDFIKHSLSDPVKPADEIDPEIIAESQRICSKNTIHQADLIIRQLIQEKMTLAKGENMGKPEMKKLAANLSQHKSDMMRRLRQGAIYVDDQIEIADSSKDKTSQLYKIITQQFNNFTS